MEIRLKKLNIGTFLMHRNELYNLLDTNRSRLEPWFWWASKQKTPNKARFSLLVLMFILDTYRKQITHKFNSKKLYDEQFIIYTDEKIGGMFGLDNIDTFNARNAEMWGLAFNRNPIILTDTAISKLENYCITDLKLDSLYTKVQSTNRASKICNIRNGYTLTKFEKNVRVSARNPNIVDMCTYVKQLTR